MTIDPLYEALHEELDIIHYFIPRVDAADTSPGQLVKKSVRKNSPLVILGYANDWIAIKWFDFEGKGFEYLKSKVAKVSTLAHVQTKYFKNWRESSSSRALPQPMPFEVALDRYFENRGTWLKLVRDDETGRIEKREILSIHDFDIGAKARELRHDYVRPTFLDNTLRH